MTQLVVEFERAWQALGQIHMVLIDAEKIFDVSSQLYVHKDMKAGDKFTSDNLRYSSWSGLTT